MLTQDTSPGYLQETPDFAEDPEQYVGEYPYQVQYAYPPSQYPIYGQPGYNQYPGQSPRDISYSPYLQKPSWWRWPIIHYSWVNHFQAQWQPPFLDFYWLTQPFINSQFARQIATNRWNQ